MAYKVTVVKRAGTDEELTDAGRAIFEARGENGDIKHARTREDGDTFVTEIWFASEEAFNSYHEELKALGEFRIDGVEVVSTDFSEEDVPS